MIRQSTIDKLHDMRLSAMSDAFECQCKDPDTYQGLSFEDRFGMLVDKEWDKRKSTKLQKLIRSAEFRYPNACMEDIEYHPDRNLDKGQMLEFSTCRYISDDHHIILKGASGNGKTYIACALGIAACRNFIKVRYVRLPDLLNELAVAHGDGTLKKVIKAYQKIDLLILDEFLLSPVSTEQTRELLEIIEARSVKGSVIFCYGRLPRIVKYIGPVCLGLLHGHCRPDIGLVDRRRDILAQLLRQLLDLPTDIGPGIEPGKENTPDLYARIAILLDAGDRLIELGDPGRSEDPGRGGDQYVGGTSKGIHRQHSQGRRCVDHDEIIVTGNRSHSFLQPMLLASLGQLLLGPGKHNVRWHQVIAALCVLHSLLDGGRPLHHLVDRWNIVTLYAAS